MTRQNSLPLDEPASRRMSAFHRSRRRADERGDPSEAPRRLVVKRGDRRVVVPVSNIDWIQSQGNYARIWVDGTSFLVRETMKSLSTRLSAVHFVRIQRFVIVNANRISEIYREGGRTRVILTSGKKLPVSKIYVGDVVRTLETA